MLIPEFVYTMLAVVIPAMILHAFLTRRHAQNPDDRSLPAVLILLFAVYIGIVFFLTGAGTLFDVLRPGIKSADSINLVPFSRSIDVTAYLENVLLFVPLGFFLPLIWPKTSRFWVVLFTGAAFSALIEISQLATHRSTDVDDLIMNTLGAALGWALFALFAKVTKRKNVRAKTSLFEPFLYIGVMFASHFLLFDRFLFMQLR